ncbi:MAG: sugar phosphate isomerase/epimerase [Gemmataceae bacterium]|nr:sugar phosphate isomerase/epimerase [Gemmataceae bacterium]
MSNWNRRAFLQTTAAGVAGSRTVVAQDAQQDPPPRPLTRFQIACMTLPYSQFPLQRALTGIRGAGYRHVAWGTTHLEGGKQVPVLAADAPVAQARDLAKRCRDLGLEPVMMFSTIYPEARNGLEVLRHRLLQAGAAGIPQILTFGHTRSGNAEIWIDRLKRLGPVARDQNVLLVVKQHGGETGTGAACAKITRDVDHPNIKVNYDAGNVMDYLEGKINPLEDLRACAGEVRSFCIKDHRFFPGPHQDCGPGLGEIDHYRLLHHVAFTNLTIPLCCENISAPRLPRPTEPEGIDALARRAREFLELVIQGIQR